MQHDGSYNSVAVGFSLWDIPFQSIIIIIKRTSRAPHLVWAQSKRFTIALCTTGQQQQSTQRQPTTVQQPTTLIKNGGGEGGDAEDKPSQDTQPATGVANRMKTVRLVVRAEQMSFEGLLE